MMIHAFKSIYREELENAVRNFPQEYAFGLSEVNDVAHRMRLAFDRGSYNKDSRAIKATCKRLGIKHTYTAINAYLALENAS